MPYLRWQGACRAWRCHAWPCMRLCNILLRSVARSPFYGSHRCDIRARTGGATLRLALRHADFSVIGSDMGAFLRAAGTMTLYPAGTIRTYYTTDLRSTPSLLLRIVHPRLCCLRPGWRSACAFAWLLPTTPLRVCGLLPCLPLPATTVSHHCAITDLCIIAGSAAFYGLPLLLHGSICTHYGFLPALHRCPVLRTVGSWTFGLVSTLLPRSGLYWFCSSLLLPFVCCCHPT
jgi:hypothetical protein